MSKDAKINFRDAPISLDLGSLYIHSKPNITGYVRLYGHCNSVVVCLSVVSACLNVVKLLHLTIIRGLNFQAIFMPYRLVGGIMFFCLAACLSIRQSIRSFVTNLMNTMFWKHRWTAILLQIVACGLQGKAARRWKWDDGHFSGTVFFSIIPIRSYDWSELIITSFILFIKSK